MYTFKITNVYVLQSVGTNKAVENRRESFEHLLRNEFLKVIIEGNRERRVDTKPDRSNKL